MTFEPQNELERFLVRASSDPAHRPQFYRVLAESDLFVIQEGVPPVAHQRITLPEPMQIQLRKIEFQGTLCIPVFSSLVRLQAVVQQPVAYLGINAVELMRLTSGSSLLLNPGSGYGKEITAAEAESIVDGSIWQPVERRVTKTATQVMLGQPANYPNEFVEALKRLFAKDKRVKRAWLAHFHDPTRDERPHTLIAIDAPGVYEEVSAEIGVVAANVVIPDPPVDVMPVGSGTGLDGYFLNQCKPFYVRRFLGVF